MSTNTPPGPSATGAVLLPLHLLALNGTEVRRRPGRPRTVRRGPTVDEAEYQRRIGGQLDEFVRTDPVVTSAATPSDRSSTAILDESMRAIAEEAAALAWDRAHLPVGSREAERASSRRISGLATLAGLLLERARLGPDDRVDPRDPRVRKLVALFLQSFRECASEALDPVVAERFIAEYERRFEGWDDRI